MKIPFVSMAALAAVITAVALVSSVSSSQHFPLIRYAHWRNYYDPLVYYSLIFQQPSSPEQNQNQNDRMIVKSELLKKSDCPITSCLTVCKEITVIAIENVKRELFDEISNLKKELAGLKNLEEMKYVDVIPRRFIWFDTQNIRKELDEMQNRLDQTNVTVENLKKQINALDTQTASSIGRMPNSCQDLKLIGHAKSGFYSVMDKTQSKNFISTVYCDFTKSSSDADFQKWIGFVDVKSFPVYFQAQRTSIYNSVNTIIPYERMRLNVGNAMDPATGIFTAPRTGIYFFTFSGLGESFIEVRVDLRLKTGMMPSSDWVKIGQAYGANNHGTFALESTLQLNQGDQISLYLKLGQLHEWNDSDFGTYTSFVGMLMQEDIIFS